MSGLVPWWGEGGSEIKKTIGNSHLVEGVDAVLSVLVGGVAVDSAVLVAPHHAEVLEDVEHLGHLGEDENAVPLVEAFFEQLVK